MIISRWLDLFPQVAERAPGCQTGLVVSSVGWTKARLK
jgi:hypothetical protein